MRHLPILLLSASLLAPAAAQEPRSPQPPPAPPARAEPLPPLGGPPLSLPPVPSSPDDLPPTPAAPGARARPLEGYPWDDWQMWWEHNLGPYECLTWCMKRDTLGPRPLFVDRALCESIAPFLRREVDAEVLPVLVRLLGPEPPETVQAGARVEALLAVGKLARDETHVRLLLDWTHRPGVGGRGASATALLALGLLRRGLSHDQIPAALLDEVRDVLFWHLERAGARSSMREVAAVALGLLGDQPTADGPEGHARHVARLFAYVEEHIGDRFTTPEVLLAIGHQLPESVTQAQRALLASIAWKHALGRRRAAAEVVDWATWALGRVGTAKHLSTLRRLIQRPRFSTATQRSCAAIALGTLGQRLVGADRKAAARAIRESLASAGDDALRGTLLVGLGETLAAAARAGEHETYESWVAHRMLFESASRGRGASRGHAALALGILASALGEEPKRDAGRAIRARALGVLGHAFADGRRPRTQAAAAIALGVARDLASREGLLEALTDEALDAGVRPAAAWGLGLFRQPTQKMAVALAGTARTETYGRLRQRSLRALALLGQPTRPEEVDSVALLLRDLETAGSEVERWEAIALLGRFGDERALGPLLEVLLSRERTAREQRAAVEALGQIGDLELEPAFVRLRRGIHFRSPVGYEATRHP